MSNSQQYWRGAGATIPKATNPRRKAWDRAYAEATRHHFGDGLRGAKVAVGSVLTSHGLPEKNNARVRLYRRMLRAGETLPPVVVRRAPGGGAFCLVDGHHRFVAARAEGVDTLSGLVK